MMPTVMNTLHRAIEALAKGRMLAGHAAMVSDLQALHDHPDTHEHVRAAIAPILAKHAPKPKAAKPKKAPNVDAEAVQRHAKVLTDTLGSERFDTWHAALAMHPAAHVHAVARAVTGKAGRSKHESLKILHEEHHQRASLRAYGDAAARARPF